MPRPAGETDLSTYTGRLAAAIRARREKARLSVAELAEAMKVSLPQVYKWESGQLAPRMDDLPALAAALRCSIRALMPAE